MKITRLALTFLAALGVCAGTPRRAEFQDSPPAQSSNQQGNTPTAASCSCDKSKAQRPTGRPPARKPEPDNPCECEEQKETCSYEVAKQQALRETRLGLFYLEHGLYDLAYKVCDGALHKDSGSAGAGKCEAAAIAGLRTERYARLMARLKIVDALLGHSQPDQALIELKSIQAELAPEHSILGEFDPDMNAAMARRFDRARHVKWLTWSLQALPSLFWTLVKIMAVIAAGLLLLTLISFAYRYFRRYWKYRSRKLDSETVEWTVWSILDVDNRGGSGPIMDALNPANNPLLKEPLKPSSLLLVPHLPVFQGTNGGDDREFGVMRDFLDDTRVAIDIEELPKNYEFQRHRFNQVQAFDEFDLKVGSLEAKGIVGLLRTLRKWLESGLPAAQGTVYTAQGVGPDKQTYACVRLTCNWTVERNVTARANETSKRGPDSEDAHELSNAADETLSVYASSAQDAAIDAVALSAQRAALKLFHRLLKRSSPTYATAVANFHQGVRLIDEYL